MTKLFLFMKSDQVYIQHILDAIQKIEKYIQGADFEAFSNNSMMCDAVAKELEIIGEAASKCSASFRKEHPKIPWSEVVGMRNRLIHEYFGVDLDVVWTTCQEDLPLLKKVLAEI